MLKMKKLLQLVVLYTVAVNHNPSPRVELTQITKYGSLINYNNLNKKSKLHSLKCNKNRNIEKLVRGYHPMVRSDSIYNSNIQYVQIV